MGYMTYRINILDRIRELVLDEDDLMVGPGDRLIYSWEGGYEQLTHQAEGSGTLHFGGAYHPDQGYCLTGHEGEPNDDGTGICLYCGRTLH